MQAGAGSQLKPLVADGTITRAQADALRAKVREQAAAAPGATCAAFAGITGDVVGAVSNLLPLSPAQIKAKLQSGQRLTAIARAQGVDRATLVRTIEAPIHARLATAATAGTITDAEKAALEQRLDAGVERLVDRVVGQAGHRGDPAPAETPGTPVASV